MCGIAGHTGHLDSISWVLESLAKLEYRGYDSSGISFLTQTGELLTKKQAGALSQLNALVQAQDSSHQKTKACIGHTRWATHGKVNVLNSHPHTLDGISLVHNGVIENADELKKDLLNEGVSFLSETDSEIFLHFLFSLLKKNPEKNLPQVFSHAFKKIRGSSAITLLCQKSETILGIKRGTPLVYGLTSSPLNLFISSDPHALPQEIEKFFFPEDDTLCIMDPNNLNSPLSFFNPSGGTEKLSPSEYSQILSSLPEKGSFPHFMIKEIHEQPALIRSWISYYQGPEGKEKLKALKKLSPSRVFLPACGTAHFAGALIKSYLETKTQIPCHIALASEFRYLPPPLKKNDLGVFISQSGETADTLGAYEKCRQEGMITIGIINNEGSTLERGCDYTLPTKAGKEIAVASTKAFTQQVLTGLLLSWTLKKQEPPASFWEELFILSQKIETLLKENQEEIKEIAKALAQKKRISFYWSRSWFPYGLRRCP